MADLAKLRLSKRTIKSAITRHQSAVNALSIGDDTATLEERNSDLKQLLNSFRDIQAAIELIIIQELNDNDKIAEIESKHDEERDQVENQYFEVMGKIKSLLSQSRGVSVNQNVNRTNSITNQNHTEISDATHLKPIPLPRFTGKYSEWYTFFDSFTALVHNNDKLTDISKFHYLRGCLHDDALQAIEFLSISNSNYKTALQTLKNRFDNKRLIAQEHVNNILNIAPMAKTNQSELRHLIDRVNNNLAALRIMELPVDSWDFLLISILSEKLDYSIKREWQAEMKSELPTFLDFSKFLENKYHVLEAVAQLKPMNHQSTVKQIHSVNPTRTFAKRNIFLPARQNSYNVNNTSSLTAPNCSICKNTHFVNQCPEFLKLSIADRLSQINKLKHCTNCLRGNHQLVDCRSRFSCKECRGNHHTLLHITQPRQINLNTIPSTSDSQALIVKSNSEILLSTAIVHARDINGKIIECRVLLDQGSQINLISESFFNKLGLKSNQTHRTISGIGKSVCKLNQSANILIKSRLSNFEFTLHCLIIPKIAELTPSLTFSKSLIKIPTNIALADPNFNHAQEIDILIGSEHFWNLMLNNKIKIDASQPYLVETTLGWIIGGKLTAPNRYILNYNSCHLSVDLETQVSRFWDQEEIQNQNPIYSPEQLACENHFTAFYKRDKETGKFIVKLPFVDNPQLGESYNTAVHRFINLENKFKYNSSLKIQYANFMNEYEALDHMELLPDTANVKLTGCFLAHHAVFKQTLNGPKIRIVFDASSKTSNHLSLNDILLTGAVIQDELSIILLRFRTYKFVLTGDIRSMYRNIMVDTKDADFQKIVWRTNPHEPLKVFKLKTVTYGTTCAPFLATRTLKQLALDNEKEFPVASKVIQQSFYMDDVLCGSNNLEEITQLKIQLSQILNSGGFNLHDWTSNSKELNLDDKQFQSIELNKENDVKVLGLRWDSVNDSLKFNVDLNAININQTPTKRSILSMVAKIFDPLGIINPVIVKAKLILQLLWTHKLSWDEAVPENLSSIWLQFLTNLHEINKCQVPRNTIRVENPALIELHGFSDASTQAYGCCLYIKAISIDGSISVNLLCAKSRVAPLKSISLPRLELNAAVLLVKLANQVLQKININFNSKFYWCDSTIVLSWIAEPAYTWKTYVANRVSEIQQYTSACEWRHVNSENNPADILSRGAYPSQLVNCLSWWQGPQFLSLKSESLPEIHTIGNKEALPDQRIQSVLTVTNPITELPIFSKFKSFNKIVRIFAYCLRFINRCKLKALDSASPILSVNELHSAKLKILKYIQTKHFSEELKMIKLNKPKASKLSSLDPFIDKEGIIRVGGRLKHASTLMYDVKYPIVLPAKHPITISIIRDFHEHELHAGQQTTLAAIRQNYWPISARNTVKQIIKSCVKCFRANPQLINQKMGNMPTQRLQPIRCFYYSGVDYAGFFQIKQGKGKNVRYEKCYIALFICLNIRAIHLELVSDLTTEAFLAALKRFISRRGAVAELYSDNGTNFVGAERELRSLASMFNKQNFEREIMANLITKNIKWHFIPPKSPHFGGAWERAVRSVKCALRKTMKTSLLTFEEFYTVLTQIEACINSRPLTPLSNDPNDMETLTPGHFLIGERLTATAEPNITALPINRLSRWQRTEQLRQHFWKRWSREYLTQLQQRPKGQQIANNTIHPGTMVLIKEDNLPPLRWLLGRITEVHPGSDGVVRVATIKTASGVLKRSVNKLCVLPVEHDNNLQF